MDGSSKRTKEEKELPGKDSLDFEFRSQVERTRLKFIRKKL